MALFVMRPPTMEAYQFKDENWRDDPELPDFVKEADNLGHLVAPTSPNMVARLITPHIMIVPIYKNNYLYRKPDPQNFEMKWVVQDADRFEFTYVKYRES